MEKVIFYSWQSDLPNNKNRGFIQECIEQAVKQVSKENLHLELAVDRDTKGITGTPDIASTIFEKIDSATIFIADISIINSNENGRKTPNPNVLIELGYAAKTIGWNNIISIYNTEYGKIEDLPFDLRSKRPLTYEIKNPSNKSEDRLKLSNILKDAISSIIAKEQAKEEIKRYIKQQIDKEVINICNQLFKVFYGYDKSFSIESIWQLLSMTDDEINRELFEKRFLGFTVLKDWRVFMQKVQDAMNQPFFTQNADQSYVGSLIKLIRGLEAMTVVFSNENLFIETDKTAENFRIVDGNKMNPENQPDSYLLTKEISETGDHQIVDFGIIRKYNLRKCKTILVANNEYFFSLSISIRELIDGLNAWTLVSGNQIIIDPLTFKF